MESGKLRFQRGNERIDVLLRVKEVRRDAVSVQPVFRHELELDVVLVAHVLLKRSALDVIRELVREERRRERTYRSTDDRSFGTPFSAAKSRFLNTGFIDGPVLRSNVQQHEYGTILEHYQQYIAAQSVQTNNIGLVAEPLLAGPGTSPSTFANTIQQSLDTAKAAVNTAMSFEACNSVVNYDTSCVFRGFINYVPYAPCR